ncbi:alpha/beta hydrolase [Pinibacter soli]|uniref:Alpha/beta hydrolase-fold protein n=1 Tax=Pinibacter soli TaxID=3044211 RepID=A0ABT6R9P7_9BACT|nr:alpha/beta hydrolase-fold protein [Pinibacter soli]MDI3319293.1 alpha/beta hydrolase-fold protein [Pinibacter soli]
MRSLIILLLASWISLAARGGDGHRGEIVVKHFLAPSIKGNHGGEDPMRSVSVYLPAGYNESRQHYPVIYFLHGFYMNDSLQLLFTSFKDLLDQAIEEKKIHPVIVVFPNSETHFKGSFYTNSALTGNWADFIGKDIVNYIDKNFRTIPNKNSRGLAGHSMGGNGALKVGMLYSEVFGSVYALSPAVLSWSNEISVENPVFRIIDTLKDETPLKKVLTNPFADTTMTGFFTVLMIDLGRTYSPSENKKPFQAKMPATYNGDNITVHDDVKKLWEQNFTLNLVDSHVKDLKSLSGLKFDWGTLEENKHIPVTCVQLEKKLDSYGVKYEAETYAGHHSDKIGGKKGRVYTAMLPFFESHLKFE